MKQQTKEAFRKISEGRHEQSSAYFCVSLGVTPEKGPKGGQQRPKLQAMGCWVPLTVGPWIEL